MTSRSLIRQQLKPALRAETMNRTKWIELLRIVAAVLAGLIGALGGNAMINY